MTWPMSIRQPCPPPEPGEYANVPAAMYHSWAAVSASVLCEFYERKQSPKHLRHWLCEPPSEPTDAMAFGTLVHCALLEPERWAACAVEEPAINRRSSTQREELEAWTRLALEGGRIVVPHGLMNKVQACAESVMAHGEARHFLVLPGSREHSRVFDSCGLRCKLRCDIESAQCVVDLKTCRALAHFAYEWEIHKYHHDVRAGFYRLGVPKDYVLIVVENEPPFDCAVFNITETTLRIGEQRALSMLSQLRQCCESGEWPGFPGGIHSVGLPEREEQRESANFIGA